MGWWPWSKPKPEQRSAAPYTDMQIAALEAAAVGQGVGDPGAIAALESATALYANAFAGARVAPAAAAMALTPSVMSLMARNLLRKGEDHHRILVRDGRVKLMPVGFAHSHGDSPDPMSWTYAVTEYGPSGSRHSWLPAAAVLHTRYSVDPSRPWHGQGPLHWAHRTGALAAYLESRLSEEVGAATGHLLPVPADGGDGGDGDPLAALKQDIAGARGRTLLVETVAAGWGEGKSAAPSSDWRPSRFGANVPDSSVSLRTSAGEAVLSACGVPISLMADSDGTSQREGWRRFAAGSVAPLLAIVAEECSRKLDVDVSFDLSSLYAHDLAGRAGAFQRLVSGGVPVGKALVTAGLLTEDGQ